MALMKIPASSRTHTLFDAELYEILAHGRLGITIPEEIERSSDGITLILGTLLRDIIRR